MESLFYTSDGHSVITLQGDWTIQNAAELSRLLASLSTTLPPRFTISPKNITALDTAGVWILLSWMRKFEDRITFLKQDLNSNQRVIFDRIEQIGLLPQVPPLPKVSFVRNVLEIIGGETIRVGHQLYLLLNFLGVSSLIFLKSLFHPKTWRMEELARHIRETGFNAVPIIMMMGFLISVVLAYQGEFQLKKFGAEIFTIDLVAISVLREMGVLVTAIIVSGRSGSAFAAEIGVMKVNEEIDALRTLGLSPITVLVLPRILALLITLPLLTFLTDMMGLLGAAVLLMPDLGINLGQFMERVNQAIVFSTFGTGMLKAPVFAGIIALVGCLRGMQVTSSAESVGEMTTRAVVESIVLVLLSDALFSLLFTRLNI